MARKNTRSDASAAARAARAMELRIQGYRFEQIARECGYADRASAYNAVKRELARTVQEPATELRQLEAERLDTLLRTFLPLALTGDNGACARVLDISRRRAALLGIDIKPEEAQATNVRRVYEFR